MLHHALIKIPNSLAFLKLYAPSVRFLHFKGNVIPSHPAHGHFPTFDTSVKRSQKILMKEESI